MPHAATRGRILAAITALTATAAAPLPGGWQTHTVPPSDPLPEASPLWYRCHFTVPDRLVDDPGDGRDLWRNSMVLAVADAPGPLEVFLNGQRIASSEGIADGDEARFKIPKGILEKGRYNCLALRLEGASAKRGLTAAPVFLDYFHELAFADEWGVAATALAEGALLPLPDRPAAAAYEAGRFRLAARPLSRFENPFPGKRVAPEVALELLEAGDGLAVDPVLSEPEVAQPTHLSFDARGRMWVSQYRQYPFPAGVEMVSRDQYYRSKYNRTPPAPPHHDRGADVISVHEDRDGDGVYESSRRVLEGLNMANAALHGWGGIWVMHTPHLLFYPDADGDATPDAPPEVRLTGFGLEDTHSVANGLAWGPDGWLYGAHGSTTTSRVVRPGTDPADAAGLYNEGPIVWRYHPRSRAFEVFADGGGNTFGLAFDAEGRLFSGHNGGGTRGFHFIQNGLYLKQGKNPGKFGPPPNPFAYGELPMMPSTNPVPRFSHAVIPVGGSAMPRRLRGALLAADPLHHHIVAADRIPRGSSFATTDTSTPLRTDDDTFRPVYLANAPCGGVMVADFREEFIAHGQNYQGQIDPDSGRIYRLRDRAIPLVRDRDLASKSSTELLALLAHDNLWHRGTAVRLLAERADEETVEPLQELLSSPDPHPALEALWALHSMGRLGVRTNLAALRHPAPMVRAWAVRLAGDPGALRGGIGDEIRRMAGADPSPEVRCQILSTARQTGDLSLVLASLSAPDGLLDDPFIPMMTWLAIEDHCETPGELLDALAPSAAGDPSPHWTAPLFREHIAARLMRRFADSGTGAGLAACEQLLDFAPSEADRAALTAGFEAAFDARVMPPLPDGLLARLGKTSLGTRIRAGDAPAIERGLALLTSPDAPPDERLDAVRAFGSRHTPAAETRLLEIALDAPAPTGLRAAALVALGIYDAPQTGAALAAALADLPDPLQAAAINLLASRPSWARALVDAMTTAEGALRGQLTPDLRARLEMHGDPALDQRLATLQPAGDHADPGDRTGAIEAVLAASPGDPYAGEPLFNARCASCHRLFFKGGTVGPDLTRYQRDDLSTLLPAILSPDAEIREGYENVLITTADGRVLSGFLADETAALVTLRGFDGADIAVARSDIETLTPAGRSLMPEGLLDGLTDTQLRDLFAYLRLSQPITQ